MPFGLTQCKYYVDRFRDTIAAYSRWAGVATHSRLPLYRNQHSRGRHLLLLAWWFPPHVTGGTYRPAALVRRAEELGWRVTVIAGSIEGEISSAGKYLLQQLPHTISVVRVPESKLEPSYRWFPRLDGEFVNVLETYALAKKVCDRNPPAVVMASGPPFHNFVAAQYLAKHYDARLVLEYRDEWTECPFGFVNQGSVDRTWESRCVEKADGIIFTTRSQSEHHASVFPGPAMSKRHVIPNGWDPEDFNLDSDIDDETRSAGRLVVSFVGSLSGHCLAGEFLRTLEAVLDKSAEFRNDLCVRFVGYKSIAAAKELADFRYANAMRASDVVPKPAATKIMRESSALLVLNDSRFERYLPGKLYDYLAAGPPLLVFGEGGEIEALVRRLNAGLVLRYGSPDDLCKALRLLKTGAVQHNDIPNIKSWLQEHTRSVLAEKTFRLLDALARS